MHSIERLIRAGCVVGLVLVVGCQQRDGDVDAASQTAAEASQDAAVANEESALPWIYSEIDTAGLGGGWKFVFGTYDPIGLPISAFLQLYAIREGEVVQIESVQDLKNLEGLAVDTPAGALALVRLFTAEETYVVFEDPMAVEIDLDDATATAKGDAFLVTRHLVYEAGDLQTRYPCHEITEQVTRDGAYKVLQRHFVRNVRVGEFPLGEFY